MANQKQDGSNLINAEYSCGSCPTLCEQCFVNFGDRGICAALQPICRPSSYKKAVQYGKEDAGKSIHDYVPPPKLTAAQRRAIPEGHIPLPVEVALTPKGTGTFNYPASESRDTAWITRKRAEKKTTSIQFVHSPLSDQGIRVPMFLRVSSMSDSSWAPWTWLAAVRAAWGNQCFFNSSSRAVCHVAKAFPKVTEQYHKLVVTTNHGFQAVPKRPARTYMPFYRNKQGKITTPPGWLSYPSNNPHGAMGPAGVVKPADFFHPQTVTAGGAPELESVIKWYRLRAIPTIAPVIETDRPVVVTQLRFKSSPHMAEFARRYGLGFEETKRGTLTVLRLWSNKDDARNSLVPLRGEVSEYMHERGWFRPITPFNWAEFVCDRHHGSCQFCGLCATLDGTQADGINWDNWVPPEIVRDIMSDPDERWRSLLVRKNGTVVWNPRGPSYMGIYGPHEDAEIFKSVVMRAGFTEEEFGVRNPRGPLDTDACRAILKLYAKYIGGEDYFCEGWNTHEDAATALALAIWSLMCHSVRNGRGMEWVVELVDEWTGGLDPWTEELVTMWTGHSIWLEHFGPVR